mgnify:CR=1 FL=1
MMAITKRRVQHLIEEYNLHRAVPVDLSPLEDIFLVRWENIQSYGMNGMILPPRAGWPATPQSKARVVLDRDLHERQARLTLAHEIGHALCEHVGTFSSVALGINGKHEREAWEVASMLLIPWGIVAEEREVSLVAAACEVPEALVHLWQSLNDPASTGAWAGRL